ncbi:hypothetical protein BCR37DRAFT_390249 [Protomyces lactucae-debilis]|uniref:Uncharacterized protein n=1 Tax=Protomyces lactucae-debilis TaxID=2754530 RepID=A0A1Y2FUN5_PROLT|nr:uncharacterized protein BCR37DRAFT_390249 [Protomyces lactucae-debilis]ORY87718.1 hypothetical protein BCR37DRAFT_390249 [Protomyces lactucae-debilis]
MSGPKAKLTFDTLSALRPRKIDPKYAALGQMTRMVEAAELKARGPGGKPNAFVNKTSAFLERMANRSPGQNTRNLRNVQPLGVSSSRRPQGQAKTQVSEEKSVLTAALDTLASRRSPTGATGPSSMGGSGSDRVSFRRDVASLDRLAASAGIDSSAGAVQKRRSYADKVAERQRGTPSSVPGKGTKTGTRFALPAASTMNGGRRMGGPQRRGGTAGGPGGPRKVGETGNRPARPQSKVQLDEAERQRRLEARRVAERPVAVDYEAPDLAHLTEQLTLADANEAQESGWASYKAVAKLLQQGHDATTLVATNRSIVPKRVVLQKIAGWLPEVRPISRTSQPEA